MILAGLKFVHIAALLGWCAALIALPVMLTIYGQARRQATYAEFRLITHFGYIGFATPAAVVAVGSGIALIFAAQVFDLWFAAKLAFVSLMALVHAWIGHLILQSGEGEGTYRMPPAILGLLVGIPAMAAVFWLVLAKPDLTGLTDFVPEVFLAPLGDRP
ncbi:Uncharacterized membrane protein [Loktanella fryxellensis]|uniref:Uncharacterized membrane protein n=1 Tax=Loktanella fryxellensis TaxID=245187 RepID=A0A1H8JVJ7_9RHOB|nr:CopD family protein [Loktanella fryxellensis]SEN84740.1 Uncharacterized membrane protein [Loktanella fryxellensis]